MREQTSLLLLLPPTMFADPLSKQAPPQFNLSLEERDLRTQIAHYQRPPAPFYRCSTYWIQRLLSYQCNIVTLSLVLFIRTRIKSCILSKMNCTSSAD